MNTYAQLSALVPQDIDTPIHWAMLLTLIPSLCALAQTPQDASYHGEGDVWTHTQMVCQALCTLPDYKEADPVRRFVLFYAALLHDIAKPSCTVLEEDGRITSAGHSRRGAVDARLLLWRAQVPFHVRERICGIIAAHQVPFFAIRGDRNGQSAQFIVRKRSHEVCLRELICVAEADIRGRICTDQQKTLDDITLFRMLAEEEGCLDAPGSFPDTHTRISYFRSGGSIAADYPFFQEPGSKVIVLSGLPASGKNSWVEKHAKDLPVISYDDAREELGLKHGASNAGAAVHLATDRAKALLRQKHPFVWNATHLSERMRQKTLDLLYAYHAEVKIIYLEASEKEIKSRNTKRDTTLTNAGIDKMLCHWEIPLATEAHEVTYEVASDQTKPHERPRSMR